MKEERKIDKKKNEFAQKPPRWKSSSLQNYKNLELIRFMSKQNGD
jgi:hypothetical protein